jgi:predicted nucleic acid-binding protein
MRTEFVLFDSSILIDLWRAAKHRDRIHTLRGNVCVSTVVFAELRRCATVAVERNALEVLQKNHRILSPTEKNWIESGRLLAKIRVDHGFYASKLRDLHFDVLIALTARSHGATLITSNRSDFEFILSYRDSELELG